MNTQNTSRLRILVNAGPTREFFDSVRFISNPSTGKQGYAIAEVAARRGHTVTLVSGPVALDKPSGVEVVHVTSAAEMADACKAQFTHCDAAIMTAAVCDYRPAHRSTHKLHKRGEAKSVLLEPTEDICATLGATKVSQIVVGFAMDDVDGLQHAERKLREKKCDLIVHNGIENVGADQVRIQLLSSRQGWQDPISGTKAQIAEYLVSVLENAICPEKSLPCPSAEN